MGFLVSESRRIYAVPAQAHRCQLKGEESSRFCHSREGGNPEGSDIYLSDFKKPGRQASGEGDERILNT